MLELHETLERRQQYECISNEQFFNNLIHDTQNAQSRVCLSTFSWDSGTISERMIKALSVLRSRQPVIPISLSINQFYPHIKQHDWTPFPWRTKVAAAYRQFQHEMRRVQHDLGITMNWAILNHEKCYIVDDTMYITDANIGDQHNAGTPVLKNENKAWPGLTVKIQDPDIVDAYIHGTSGLSGHKRVQIMRQKAFGPRHIYQMLQESVYSPECESLVLISPYPGGVYHQLLAQASYNGVRTALVQPTPDARNRRPLSEHIARFQISNPYINMLVAGVHIGFSPTMFHGKAVIIRMKNNHEILVTGSDNFDSNLRFDEIVCRTGDSRTITQAHQLFIDPIVRNAIPFEEYYGYL